MAASDARPVPKKNVAYRVTFPILDADGDLVTSAGSLDSEVSKDGGTFTDCTNEATEIATSSGMYYLDLTNTEMNADTVAIIVKSTGGKTTPIVLYPEEAGDIRVDVTQWNSSNVATPTVAGVPEVDVTHMEGGTQTVTDLKDFADAGYDPATNKVQGVVLVDTTTTNTDMVSEPPTAAAVADQVWDEAKSGHVGAGSFGEEVQAHALSSEISALNDVSTAEVNAEVDTALSDIGLDHLLSAAVVGADVTNNSVIAYLVSKSATADWDDFVNTTDALQAIRDKQTDIETDTQDIQSRLPAALVGGAMDSDVSNIQNGAITAAAIATDAVDADALATDAVDEIADGVWDEIISGAAHNTANSAGRRLRILNEAVQIEDGTAQAGAASTITLAAGANANDNFYNHTLVVIIGGTGVGQARSIDTYTGSSKVADVIPNWVTNPDNTSDYIILAAGETHVAEVHAGAIDNASFAAGAIDAAAIATGAVDADALATDAVAEIADGVWDEARSGHSTAGTYGESFFGMVHFAAEAGTLSTTQATTDLAEATDDHYIGRTIVWLTGVLAGQATDVTDYAGANGLLTFTAVTEAPSATDRGILV